MAEGSIPRGAIMRKKRAGITAIERQVTRLPHQKNHTPNPMTETTTTTVATGLLPRLGFIRVERANQLI